MPRTKNSESKRAFVLSQPAAMSAREIVERARMEGIRLKEHYVYVVRSTARREQKLPPAKRASRATGGKAEKTPEMEFRRLTLELGLGKSKELLRETEQKIADLIEGK